MLNSQFINFEGIPYRCKNLMEGILLLSSCSCSSHSQITSHSWRLRGVVRSSIRGRGCQAQERADLEAHNTNEKQKTLKTAVSTRAKLGNSLVHIYACALHEAKLFSLSTVFGVFF